MVPLFVDQELYQHAIKDLDLGSKTFLILQGRAGYGTIIRINPKNKDQSIE
ncbi:Hypothetical protein POVR1_LOCUS186 [uncultured virus]|nr:Hypothetical protein POVR1_LOCUS186 [uncultured virus]